MILFQTIELEESKSKQSKLDERESRWSSAKERTSRRDSRDDRLRMFERVVLACAFANHLGSR
jgi:hypothetical protein